MGSAALAAKPSRAELNARAEKALELMLATSAGRRDLAENSPTFFDTYYCGMEAADHRTRWLEEVTGAYVIGKTTGKQQRVLLLAPRKHGKTETAITLAVQLICMNRDIRILLICSTSGNAKKRIKRIKALLASKRIQQDWCSGTVEEGLGPFRSQRHSDRIWTSTAIEVERASSSVNPTLEGLGIGGTPTGDHVDVVILDDVEDKKRVKTAAVRAETREFVGGTVIPTLAPDGLLLAIGTRKHNDDLYSHLLEDPTWDVITDPAIIKFPASMEPVYETDEAGRRKLVDYAVSGDYQVLWPGRRPLQYLLRIRAAIGSTTFAREFLNQVMDLELAQFRIEWLERGKLLGQHFSLGPQRDGGGLLLNGKNMGWPSNLVVVQAWDLALVDDERRAQEQDTDYTVGLTWGWQPSTNLRFLMDMYRKRGLTPQQIQDAIHAMYERWQVVLVDGSSLVRRVVVEKNSFGRMHTWALGRGRDFEGKLRTKIPLRPHMTTGPGKADPYKGLPALQAVYEQKGVVLPQRTERDRAVVAPFVTEHIGFGVERHDDTVLAEWIAECGIRGHISAHDGAERKKLRKAERMRQVEAIRAGRRAGT